MPDGRSKQPPAETLVDLRRRLSLLPARDPARKEAVTRAADLFGISVATLYRCLREQLRPKSVRRADHGVPKAATLAEMERYAEIIAALKVRTSNKQGRKISTKRAIELLEDHGVETPDGLVKAPKGRLARATIDRFMRQAGYDHRRIIQPSAAVRFQARRSNELWQFDMSPSDLKHVKAPLWSEESRGKPTLMLFSVVDDRSGADYEEYRCVYGEDAESALRFLFNAMAPKPEEEMPFQGIPESIYMDNGPVSRSKVFQSVMGSLGVRILTHLPPSKDQRRTAARAKGKVERPFRTVKEAHETLYHFHEPKDEAEANLWLRRYLINYNNQKHRSEPHSRVEDWLKNLPPNGVHAMCSWERFCAFAREPEKRQVGGDARISIDGAEYEVDPDSCRRDRDPVVGPVRPGTVRRARRQALWSLQPFARRHSPLPVPKIPKDQDRGTDRSRHSFGATAGIAPRRRDWRGGCADGASGYADRHTTAAVPGASRGRRLPECLSRQAGNR